MTGCGYLPTGYLPTGYFPPGYLPIGAAATGGGSLRGKSAAAATLSMARSPAVTIVTIFMMQIPLYWAPGRADRVTPLFRFVCARRPLLPSHVPAQSPGNGSRLFVASAGRMVQTGQWYRDRTRLRHKPTKAGRLQTEWQQGLLKLPLLANCSRLQA